MTVLKWALAAAGVLVGTTLLAHLITAVIDPLLPLLFVLIFVLGIFAVAIRGR